MNRQFWDQESTESQTKINKFYIKAVQSSMSIGDGNKGLLTSFKEAFKRIKKAHSERLHLDSLILDLQGHKNILNFTKLSPHHLHLPQVAHKKAIVRLASNKKINKKSKTHTIQNTHKNKTMKNHEISKKKDFDKYWNSFITQKQNSNNCNQVEDLEEERPQRKFSSYQMTVYDPRNSSPEHRIRKVKETVINDKTNQVQTFQRHYCDGKKIPRWATDPKLIRPNNTLKELRKIFGFVYIQNIDYAGLIGKKAAIKFLKKYRRSSRIVWDYSKDKMGRKIDTPPNLSDIEEREELSSQSSSDNLKQNKKQKQQKQQILTKLRK